MLNGVCASSCVISSHIQPKSHGQRDSLKPSRGEAVSCTSQDKPSRIYEGGRQPYLSTTNNPNSTTKETRQPKKEENFLPHRHRQSFHMQYPIQLRRNGPCPRLFKRSQALGCLRGMLRDRTEWKGDEDLCLTSLRSLYNFVEERGECCGIRHAWCGHGGPMHTYTFLFFHLIS